ncbi:MAG TPA: TonB family protein [Blastocatellia bacterium]|nr:TonB family protein [Blastocatellia bacterium]
MQSLACRKSFSRVTFLLWLVLGVSVWTVNLPPKLFAAAQEETAEMFVERAKKALQNDEWGRVKAAVVHALALKPDLAEAHFLLAQVHEHDGDLNRAMDALGQAVRFQPAYPEAHFMLARLLVHMHVKLQQAREEASTALTQGFSAFAGNALLGEIELAQSRYPEAITYFETALREQIDNEEAATRLRRKIAVTKRIIQFEAEQDPHVDVRPQPLNNSFPRYSEEARAKKIQGMVLLIALINEQGEVGEAEVVSGLGYGLDEAAEEAVRGMKFSPAKKDGKPVPFHMKVTVEFNLR